MLDYSSLRGVLKFQREDREDGVAFSATAPMSANVFAAFVIALLLLLLTLPNLSNAADPWPMPFVYRLRPISFAITFVIFAAAMFLTAASLWRRRSMPVCVTITGDQLVVLLPHAVRNWRQIYQLADVQSVTAVGAGPMVARSSPAFLSTGYRLQKAGTLQARIAGKNIRLLHAYALQDMEEIAQEIDRRITALRRAPASADAKSP